MSYSEKDFLDFEGLSYYDGLIKGYIPITHGYYYNGNFYSDSSFTTLIAAEDERLYVGLNTKSLYEYLNNSYHKINGTNIVVSSTQPTNQVAGDIWLKLE